MIANVTVGLGASAAAYDAASGFVYVVDSNISGPGKVVVISGTNLVGSVPIGRGEDNLPGSIVYDANSSQVYVANEFSNSISVISGTNLVANISLGYSPYDMTVDAQNGYVYVADYNQNVGSGSGSTVSVISGTQLIANVTVGAGPAAIAYNPFDKKVYVADYVPGRLDVISGTSVVANVTLQSNPDYMTVDPTSGYVYICNALAGSPGTIEVVSNYKVIATLNGGTFPSIPLWNPINGYVYVDSRGQPGPQGNSSILVISGTKVIGNVTVGNDADGMAYDSRTGVVYVALYGPNSVAVISATALTGNIAVGEGPTAVAYDPVRNYVYVVNSGFINPGTVSVISPG